MDETPACRTETLLAADLCHRTRLRAAADRARLLRQAEVRRTSPVGALLVSVGKALVRAGEGLQARESVSANPNRAAIRD